MKVMQNELLINTIAIMLDGCSVWYVVLSINWMTWINIPRNEWTYFNCVPIYRMTDNHNFFPFFLTYKVYCTRLLSLTESPFLCIYKQWCDNVLRWRKRKQARKKENITQHNYCPLPGAWERYSLMHYRLTDSLAHRLRTSDIADCKYWNYL